MTLALAVLTDIDVKFIFDHNQLYSFAAVTQTCPEHVIPIIRNVCVVRPVEKGASTDDGASLVRCALSMKIMIVRVFLDLSFDIKQNAEVVGFPIFKEDTDPFQRLARAFHSRVERSGS